MRTCSVVGKNLTEAYHKALEILELMGDETPCPAWNTNQKEVAMEMVVDFPLLEPRISACTICGPEELQQYVMEMTQGILDFEVEKGKWAYTYHKRFADQIPPLIEELKRDPNSRRACLLVRRPEDIYMSDPPCLQHIQFFIRNNKLDCYVLFRSNDAVKATFMNAFALIKLQEMIAAELNIEVGQYVHRANSFHCYEKDYPLLKSYVSRYQTDPTKIVYNYKNDWEEDMNDAVEEILHKVEDLRNH